MLVNTPAKVAIRYVAYRRKLPAATAAYRRNRPDLTNIPFRGPRTAPGHRARARARTKAQEPSAVRAARARQFRPTERAWPERHTATVCNGSYEAYWMYEAYEMYDANWEFRET
ncbi:hypothetical protein GCM10010349_06190 [Streptomyces flavofungini]|nr:hypothetical protein GCM10010349_06190 [Streptomyces flavofungini]